MSEGIVVALITVTGGVLAAIVTGVFALRAQQRRRSSAEPPTSPSDPTPGLPEWAGKFIRAQNDYALFLASIETKDQILAELDRYLQLARKRLEYLKKYISLTAQQHILFEEHYPNRLKGLDDRIQAEESRLKQLGVRLEDESFWEETKRRTSRCT